MGASNGANEWAKERGIIKTCDIHKKDYDAHIGCPECIREKKASAKRLSPEEIQQTIANSGITQNLVARVTISYKKSKFALWKSTVVFGIFEEDGKLIICGRSYDMPLELKPIVRKILVINGLTNKDHTYSWEKF